MNNITIKFTGDDAEEAKEVFWDAVHEKLIESFPNYCQDVQDIEIKSIQSEGNVVKVMT